MTEVQRVVNLSNRRIIKKIKETKDLEKLTDILSDEAFDMGLCTQRICDLLNKEGYNDSIRMKIECQVKWKAMHRRNVDRIKKKISELVN